MDGAMPHDHVLRSCVIFIPRFPGNDMHVHKSNQSIQAEGALPERCEMTKTHKRDTR